jgi:aspartate oxidase
MFQEFDTDPSGGTYTDWVVSSAILDGRTTLNGLYAIGEASLQRVAWGNRLGSNSLLEGLT